jgi:hypothetical protein
VLDIHVHWNILTMYGTINVKSPNNTIKWQMGFNSAFKGLNFLQVRYGHKCEHTLKLYVGVVVKFGIRWKCVVRFVSSKLYFWEDIPMPNVICVCVCVCVCVGFVMCGCFGNMYSVPLLRFYLS